MSRKRASTRSLKREVSALLESADFDRALAALHRLPPRKVFNALMPFLCSADPETKWKAISFMGPVVKRLAETDRESAREILRRLMWNLNDESGGIGWGAPEAMGEILASDEALAREYVQILVSYAREDGNFQEQWPMQRGVLWAIGRLAQAAPGLLKEYVSCLLPYLRSPDGEVRAHAVWIMGLLRAEEARPCLDRLRGDDTEIALYVDRRLINRQVKALVEEALERLSFDGGPYPARRPLTPAD